MSDNHTQKARAFFGSDNNIDNCSRTNSHSFKEPKDLFEELSDGKKMAIARRYIRDVKQEVLAKELGVCLRKISRMEQDLISITRAEKIALIQILDLPSNYFGEQ